MEDRDRDNLRFLLSASPEVLRDWFEHVDDDDIDYAFDLLEMYRLELIDLAVDETEFQEANEVIEFIKGM